MRRSLWLCLFLLAVGCESSSEEEVEETVDVVETLSVHEALAMPEKPTLNPEDFDGAATCEFCHPAHVEEWSTSSHAYAMQDPVFQALVKRRQEDLNATEDQFCTQCHSSIGTRGGECSPGFSFEDLSEIVMEGVTCVSCHQVTEMERNYNSGHVLSATAPMMGGIADPQETKAHGSVADPLIQSAAFCGGCHDVVETNGLNLERPYEEWIESPLGGTEQTCQSCHMRERQGEAVEGGPIRTLHSHRFLGVGLPLKESFIGDEDLWKKLEGGVEALLRSSARLHMLLPESVVPESQMDLVVTIENLIPGHNLPTGSNFMRQFWLDIEVTDGEGRVLYRSGDRDEAGDLRNIWSELDPFGDPDLITLTSELLGPEGDPVLYPWEAVELVNRAIAPSHERTYTLFVPIPADVSSPITVSTSLLFREFAPYFLRSLGLDEYVPKLIIRKLFSAEESVHVE